MKETVIMLMLLGCDCDGIACQYIRTVSADWSSLERCQEAAGEREIFSDEVSFPLAIAQCVVENDTPNAQMASSANEPTRESANLRAAADTTASDGWMTSLDRVRHRVAGLSGDAISSLGSTSASIGSGAIDAFPNPLLAWPWD